MNKPSTLQTSRLHPVRRFHPLGRMLFAAGLLISLMLMQKNIPMLLGVLAGSVGVLYWLGASWMPVLRAARLLMWLVLPVVCLHLMFTPGALLWPGSGIGFTREGLQEGVWLGLRLCAMFYGAMLLSRSLSREEWGYYCLCIPRLGPILLPYVMLSSCMRGIASRALSETRINLNLKAGWRDAQHLLQALGDVVALVWHGSAEEAEKVWRRWDEQSEIRQPSGSLLAGGMLGAIGVLMPLGLWMAG